MLVEEHQTEIACVCREYGLAVDLQPIVNQQERRPQARMGSLGILQQRELGLLQRDGLRGGRVLEIFVELRDELGRGFVIDKPKGRQGTFRPGLDCHPSQTEGRSIVTCRGLAGTQRQ